MAHNGKPSQKLRSELLTPDRWSDLVSLFGRRGACGGCWCMTWHQTSSEYERRKGTSNRNAFRRRVKGGKVPGILMYRGQEPVGWCAVEPRLSYSRLARSRILAPVDDEPVWSIVCLFVAKDQRGSGVSVALLEAAARHARSRGARVIEGYPVAPKEKPMPDVFAFTGTERAFQRAGYEEVARRSPTRPIMRRRLRGGRTPVGRTPGGS